MENQGNSKQTTKNFRKKIAGTCDNQNCEEFFMTRNGLKMHKIICPYNTVHTVPDQTEHVEIDGNDFNTKENGRTIDASMEEQKLHIMKTIGMKDEDYDIHSKECSDEGNICLTHFSRIYDYLNPSLQKQAQLI